MYEALVRMVVRPGKRSEFLEFPRCTTQVARECEPGTLRQDVWEVETEPDVVYVYDVLHGEADFETHINNEPVQEFGEIMNDLVEGWTMVIPSDKASPPEVR
ncbi:putative quinol monooxygenase [Nonomuraea aurantiaca]|uniref:putative quinol monooxygenase n=1 Tax=Nonomuraea aurantiaca TaxID=2878562 RepID=UPI001CDA1BE9|nr:antibiotic biosynthesis monooxygenase [Nonomuraea aurantiaca]MCA2220735.1 antibiotic biosynthesis monooxygenase [Nonomuraea aurantiaca]